MGAGKTTIGRKLAKLLHLDFIDTDHLLEQRTGVSISHIFEIEGESGFRDRESRLLAEISNSPPTVVSTGGGIILRPENRRIIRKHGRVIYLRATVNVLWKRLKNCQSRPLLQAPDPKDRLSQLLLERDPLYADEADIIVDIGSGSATRTTRQIHQLITSNSSENS